MTDVQMLQLMEAFRRAYARGDREGLMSVTSTDFVWHQHYAEQRSELPQGRVLHGVDALLEQLQWRAAHWREVKYENLQERAAEDVLLQTFSISGIEDGTPFAADVVDLYPVVANQIIRKDTYWKYLR